MSKKSTKKQPVTPVKNTSRVYSYHFAKGEFLNSFKGTDAEYNITKFLECFDALILDRPFGLNDILALSKHSPLPIDKLCQLFYVFVHKLEHLNIVTKIPALVFDYDQWILSTNI